MQAVAEQAAAEKEAYLARHTSFMENPISKSILDMKNAQNMTDLAERQANAAIAAQVAIDEAAAKAAIEEAIAAEQAAAELRRNEIILTGNFKSSMLLKNAQIRNEFNERQDDAVRMAELKAQQAAEIAAREAAEAEARAAAEAKAAEEVKAAAEETKKQAMTRTVSQKASGKQKGLYVYIIGSNNVHLATPRSMKLNRTLNSRFAL